MSTCRLAEEQLAQASPNLLRAMVTTFAEALMGAEADAVCGAGYGERNGERRNTRNGYRRREWNTRAGSIELAIPKLRQGSYFPDWLLERRRRAEAALVTVVAASYLLGSAAGRQAASGTRRLGPSTALLHGPPAGNFGLQVWHPLFYAVGY